jgi:hypothetical protein
VNQTSGHVHTEAQKPQNQKNSNNRPKHIDLLCLSFYPCRASFGSPGMARSDFPHSKQNLWARGVISPQNGHIRWDWNCWLGLSIAESLAKNAATGFIELTFASADSLPAGSQRRVTRYTVSTANHDRVARAVLSRIAHSHETSHWRA